MKFLSYLFVIYGFICVIEAKLQINKYVVVFSLETLTEEELNRFSQLWSEGDWAYKLYKYNHLYFTASALSSSQPDNIKTLPLFSFQPKEYYQHIFNEFNSGSKDKTSLKGLLKAVQLCEPYDKILWQINSKQTDLNLLPEILKIISEKTLQVLVKNVVYSSQTITNSHYSRGEEFTSVEKASAVSAEKIRKEEDANASNNTSKQQNVKELSAFFYGIVAPTEKQLNTISHLVKEELDKQRNASSHLPDHYSLVLSSQPQNIKQINTSAQYSAEDYRKVIEPFSKEIPDTTDHLKALLNLLETTPPNSRIHFLTNINPNEKIESVPKIAQLISDKGIQVVINGGVDIGRNSEESLLSGIYVPVYDLIHLVSGIHRPNDFE